MYYNRKKTKHVIIGNGDFPTHAIAIEILKTAATIICCDGAANALYAKGIMPHVVVGDLDSILPEVKTAFADRLFYNPNTEINDQTKAVEWAIEQELPNLIILGASGKREDHTIGNIALLAEYGKRIPVQIVTDNGVFTPAYSTQTFTSFVGQQVSIFNIGEYIPLTSHGLKYPLQNIILDSWWKGTLNEALFSEFVIEFNKGAVIVFQQFPEE